MMTIGTGAGGAVRVPFCAGVLDCVAVPGCADVSDPGWAGVDAPRGPDCDAGV